MDEKYARATLRLTKAPPGEHGRDIYYAWIYIAGEYVGHVIARRGGPYEAYTKTKRLIAVGESLTEVREGLIEAYAAAGTELFA